MRCVAGYILQWMMCKRVEREREREREEREIDRVYSVTTNNYLNLMIIVAKQDGVWKWYMSINECELIEEM